MAACHIHSFTEHDLDRMLDWFSVVKLWDSDVVKDYELAERIMNARADLRAGRE